MRDTIIEQLESIERTEGVTLLLACESGSRAWGFPSPDSDYDVRFIYVRPLEWYLTTGERRAVLDYPIDDILDINGWDVKKALQLMRRVNAPLLEWLSSPIRYWVRQPALDALVALARESFLPESVSHHYLAMARSTVAKITAGANVRLKTYLYALRPVLCCEWIVRHGTQPPMQIQDLLADSRDAGPRLKHAITDLIQKKSGMDETCTIPRESLFDAYLEAQLCTLEDRIPKNPPKTELERFDSIFRDILVNGRERR